MACTDVCRPVVLQSLQTEYERVSSLKTDLQKQLDERTNELKTTKTVANSFTNQLKEKIEHVSAAKVTLSLVERKPICSLSRHTLTKTMPLYVYKYRS